jgi:hypothetical protein
MSSPTHIKLLGLYNKGVDTGVIFPGLAENKLGNYL